MLLLAFDTATPAITVALHDGVRLIAERTTIDGRRHAELLAPGIEAVLTEGGVAASDLDALAVGVGPGPFTGLRVGLMTARALADALSTSRPIPLYGVCTLDVLAASVECDEPFLVATDARRREVYWATYDAEGVRIDGPHVDRPADVQWRGPTFGAGALAYPERFADASGPELPSAAVLADMVARGAAILLPPDPLYLRRPDAVVPPPRKAVTPV